MIERPLVVSVQQRGRVRGGVLQRLDWMRIRRRYWLRLIHVSGLEGPARVAQHERNVNATRWPLLIDLLTAGLPGRRN